jgi:hypothetical protein
MKNISKIAKEILSVDYRFTGEEDKAKGYWYGLNVLDLDNDSIRNTVYAKIKTGDWRGIIHAVQHEISANAESESMGNEMEKECLSWTKKSNNKQLNKFWNEEKQKAGTETREESVKRITDKAMRKLFEDKEFITARDFPEDIVSSLWNELHYDNILRTLNKKELLDFISKAVKQAKGYKLPPINEKNLIKKVYEQINGFSDHIPHFDLT